MPLKIIFGRASVDYSINFFLHEKLFVRTIGRRQGLARVIVKEAITLGLKFRIFGYISRGESVPEVITTVWKRSKIGLTAIDASKHLHEKLNFSPKPSFN
jgi:hypothetical protein